jgi:hypothetical protein
VVAIIHEPDARVSYTLVSVPRLPGFDGVAAFRTRAERIDQSLGRPYAVLHPPAGSRGGAEPSNSLASIDYGGVEIQADFVNRICQCLVRPPEGGAGTSGF